MNETKKIVRIFLLTVIWTLFVMLTLSGIVSAGERTEYVNSGKEPQTVKINNNLAQLNYCFNSQCSIPNSQLSEAAKRLDLYTGKGVALPKLRIENYELRIFSGTLNYCLFPLPFIFKFGIITMYKIDKGDSYELFTKMAGH